MVRPSSPNASAAPPTRARRWSCRSCGALLGVEENGELHIKYKEVQHWICGSCRHRCRRCGTMNQVTVAPAMSPRAIAADEGRR